MIFYLKGKTLISDFSLKWTEPINTVREANTSASTEGRENRTIVSLPSDECLNGSDWFVRVRAEKSLLTVKMDGAFRALTYELSQTFIDCEIILFALCWFFLKVRCDKLTWTVLDWRSDLRLTDPRWCVCVLCLHCLYCWLKCIKKKNVSHFSLIPLWL